MLAAAIFINAQIIYIQSFYIGKNIVVQMLNKTAECITEHFFIFINISSKTF